MKNSVFYYLYSIDALNIDVNTLVPSSFALRYFSVIPSLYLSYASIIPPLYIRFVNEGRSSSQRRMIEFTTVDERRTNEEPTKEYICIRDGRHTNLYPSLNVFCNNSTA